MEQHYAANVDVSPTKKQTHNKSGEIFVIKKTLGFLWLIWFGVFGAYYSLEVLQSSLNPRTGVLSISLIYTSKIITSIITPLIITKLTLKWTTVISCICHLLLVLANFYPEWYTMLPAGVLVGLATPPLWTCFGVYITTLGVRYAKLMDETKSAVLSKFNGIAHTAVPVSFMIGNLISSIILKYVTFESSDDEFISSQPITKPADYNYTWKYQDNSLPSYHTNSSNSLEVYKTSNETSIQCGPKYCPVTASEDDSIKVSDEEAPDIRTVYVLLSVLGLFNLIAVLVSIFGLQNIKDDQISELPLVDNGACSYVGQYLSSLCDWRFLLLVPALCYIDVFHSYVTGMFPRAYISCNVGMDMIGYFFMVIGGINIFIYPISGFIGQYIGRNYLFLFSYVLVILQVLMWFLWEYLPNHMTVMFFTAIVAGLAMGNYNIQSNAFLGDAFTKKKMEIFAFSHFWGGITIALGFISNNYICVSTQLYILVALKVLAAGCYAFLNHYLQRNETVEITEPVTHTEEMKRICTEQA